LDFQGSKPATPTAIGLDEFQKSEIDDITRSLRGVACDDDLPRIMPSHLLRFDELPLERRVQLLDHRLVRVVRGVDENELVGLVEVASVGLEELNVLGVDELIPSSIRIGVRVSSLLVPWAVQRSGS
jgi:hypothetical protein